MYNNKIICITGADGSGKSTLIKHLLNHFPKSIKIGIWDSFVHNGTNLFSSKEAIDNYLCDLTPIARTFFLSHALQDSLKTIDKNNNTLYFIDSYFYKYYCAEIALGTPIETINSLVSFFPKPDLVVEMNIDTAICADRKSKFTRYESGLSMHPDKSSFINFQKECGKNWKYFRTENWTKVEANRETELILHDVVKKINSI